MTDRPLPLLPHAAKADATPLHLLTTTDWPAWAEPRAEGLRRLAAMADFRAQAGRCLIIPTPDGHIERVLVGLGERANPLLLGQAARDLPAGAYKIASSPAGLDHTVLSIAWAMGAYVFDRYKARRKAPAELVMDDATNEAEALRVARAVWRVRDLVNTPANDMGPEALAAEIEAVATAHGAAYSVVVGEALLAENYPLIHAVGRAAAEAPRLARLSWGDASHPLIVLVGKGVTFDSGGLDLKPSAGMRIMKKDMGGAAHALALAELVMDAKLPVRLELIVPIVENAVSASAFRPGDVIRARNGLSVEIDNTDAEGRLILADALALASSLEPDLILDYATLTGAARTALGPDLPPFFTDDEALATGLTVASAQVHDPLWRLPLWPGYDADMDTPVADLKNTGDGAFAGAIYGALFLKRFVTTRAWAHFDVYAWSPRDRPAKPTGGEANALRASWAMLATRYGALKR